jgi:formate-dependent nitrite reductase membrane component NrfD
VTEGGDPRFAGGRTAQETRSPVGRSGGKARELRMVPPAEPRSYYGRPVIKEPAWTREVPVYFFFGGLAGASAVLAFAARLTGNRRLARVATRNAFAGIAVSPPLLISDLGRPERFLHMLRVFKITSPMSVGSWVLAAEGGVVTVAAAHEFLGWFPRPLARFAEGLAAVLGLPLATYTAALIANTSVPAWHEARHELPFVFAGGAAMSAGAAAALFVRDGDGAPARRLAMLGVATEAIGMELIEHRLGDLAEPYRTGTAGKLEKATKAAAGGGGLLMALAHARRSRSLGVIASLATLAGAMLGRWTVFKAGFQSAADPKYTVAPQRERAGGPSNRVARQSERPPG